MRDFNKVYECHVNVLANGNCSSVACLSIRFPISYTFVRSIEVIYFTLHYKHCHYDMTECFKNKNKI